jgi:hypothetical protein
MSRIRLTLGSALLALLVTPVALTAQQKYYVYPAQGQSQEQQQTDESQCNQWAIQQSGVNPANPAASVPQSTQQPSNQPTGDVLKAGAGGALVGTAIGAISGDTGEGAAIGAVSGAVLGGLKRRRHKQEEEQQQKQQQQQQVQAAEGSYGQAYKACLTGRGYTVN